MISLKQHDRVGRSRMPDPKTPLPSIEERAAIARGWAATVRQPNGTRRDLRRTERPRTTFGLAAAVSAVVDPVLETAGIEDCDVVGLRAFAARMLSSN